MSRSYKRKTFEIVHVEDAKIVQQQNVQFTENKIIEEDELNIQQTIVENPIRDEKIQ